MNIRHSRKIAKTITNEQLYNMLASAKEYVVDWDARSNVNKSASIGYSWNLLAKDFDINEKYSKFIKYMMIREFGEFLPDELKIKPKPKQPLPEIKMKPKPNFDNFK